MTANLCRDILCYNIDFNYFPTFSAMMQHYTPLSEFASMPLLLFLLLNMVFVALH